MAKSVFLTNYALVLVHIGEHPTATLQQIASTIGISQRAAQSNLDALEKDGLISRRKEGRRRRYRVNIRAVLEYIIGEVAPVRRRGRLPES